MGKTSEHSGLIIRIDSDVYDMFPHTKRHEYAAAMIDYAVTNHTTEEYAAMWGWSRSKTCAAIRLFSAHCTVIDKSTRASKTPEKKSKPQMDTLAGKYITEFLLETLTSAQIASVSTEIFSKCSSQKRYEDGDEIHNEEHLRYIGFCLWVRTNAPYCSDNLRPITFVEFKKLKTVYKYTSNEIRDTMVQIENRRDLRKRYVSLYATLLNWLKNNYGDRR